jgi:RimJ/RimL family protein N-acetyltransferase
VISVIHPDNARSLRVAARLGERAERRIELNGHPAVVYGIARDRWEAAAR